MASTRKALVRKVYDLICDDSKLPIGHEQSRKIDFAVQMLIAVAEESGYDMSKDLVAYYKKDREVGAYTQNVLYNIRRNIEYIVPSDKFSELLYGIED